MVEATLMKNADKVVLTGGGETTLHSHAGGGGINTEYSESEGDSSSSSTSWQTKLTHTVVTAGVYLVQWYYEIYGSNVGYGSGNFLWDGKTC